MGISTVQCWNFNGSGRHRVASLSRIIPNGMVSTIYDICMFANICQGFNRNDSIPSLLPNFLVSLHYSHISDILTCLIKISHFGDILRCHEHGVPQTPVYIKRLQTKCHRCFSFFWRHYTKTFQVVVIQKKRRQNGRQSVRLIQ